MGETVDVLLNRAKAEESAFNWIDASKLYKEIANSYFTNNFLEKAANIYKKLGYSYERAADSAGTGEEYRKRIQFAVDSYNKAKNLFKKTSLSTKALECEADAYLINSYIANSITEVKSGFKKALESYYNTTELYSRENDQKSCARTMVRSLMTLAFSSMYYGEQEEIEELIEKGFKIAPKAWKISKDIGNIKFLTEIMYYEFLLADLLFQIFISVKNFDKQKTQVEYIKEVYFRLEETLKICEESIDARSLGMLYIVAGYWNNRYYNFFSEQEEYLDRARDFNEKSIEFARLSRDNNVIIYSLWIYIFSNLSASSIEDIQKRVIENLDEIVKLGKIYEKIHLPYYHIAYLVPTAFYSYITQRRFIKSDQRESYAKKAINYAEEFLNKPIFVPWMNSVYLQLISSYSSLISFSKSKSELKDYTKKILNYVNQTNVIVEKYKDGYVKSDGYAASYRVYKILADISEDQKEKIKMLSFAIEASKKQIEHPRTHRRSNIIKGQLKLGFLYEELGNLTKNTDSLLKAKEIFLNIVKETNIRKGRYHHAAVAYEHIARIEDRMGNHRTSAESYEKAQKFHTKSLQNLEYKLLIDNINEKKEYASAWNIIETAKIYHRSEKHLKAETAYKNASNILKDLPRYDYEAYYYDAWASLEKAEHLSKQEKQEDAIKQYEITIAKFDEAIDTFKMALKQLKEKQERERLEKLEKVGKLRINYCNARINLEEARILGRQGEHIEGAEKFAMAASKFKNICTIFKVERERKELEAIFYLCRAWESMEFAEQYENPEKYAEAADLFLKASNFFIDSKLKSLALGNSSFCQALELGCKFDESTDTQVKAQIYPKVKTMLRKAASTYGKGGFEKEADWAIATSTYFDAAWHLIKADEEMNLNEKKKLLDLGSSILESASELFGNAGYKEKKEEIIQRLNMIKKEKKILFSALGSIEEPSISRSTVGIIAPDCPMEISGSTNLNEIQEIAKGSLEIKKDFKKKPTQLFPELTKEVPVVILIMTEGGVPIFSYPFDEEWKFDDDLFGGFLSSFSSISDEIFSEGLNRAKFGQYTVLMESVENFLVCYLFKGQIFLAKDKLTKFIIRIQENSSIWRILNKFYQTNQVLELRDIPLLENLLAEVFLT